VEPVQTDVFSYATGEDDVLDVGVQFAEVEAPGGACVFVPPGDVYDEGWGGIDGVRWEPNTWGDTNLSETGDGCADASESCLLLADFAGSGLHVTYRSPFPPTTFTTLSLQLSATRGTGTVEVAPRSADARCANPTTVEVGSEWITVEIDIAASCPDADVVQGLTISLPSTDLDLKVDEIRFE
jgi:hypothetical protein